MLRWDDATSPDTGGTRRRAVVAALALVVLVSLVLVVRHSLADDTRAQSAGPAPRPAAELWTEIDAPFEGSRDRVLVRVVDGLVHDDLAPYVRSWHFFFEPELRLRVLWRSRAARAAGLPKLRSALDVARLGGLVDRWYFAAHGERGKTYHGEAQTYGGALWPVVYRDWNSGSEYALALAKYGPGLPEPRQFYFDRRVHLFANRTFGTWQAEVGLTLSHAHGYAELVEGLEHGQRARRVRHVLRLLDEANREWQELEGSAS